MPSTPDIVKFAYRTFGPECAEDKLESFFSSPSNRPYTVTWLPNAAEWKGSWSDFPPHIDPSATFDPRLAAQKLLPAFEGILKERFSPMRALVVSDNARQQPSSSPNRLSHYPDLWLIDGEANLESIRREDVMFTVDFVKGGDAEVKALFPTIEGRCMEINTAEPRQMFCGMIICYEQANMWRFEPEGNTRWQSASVGLYPTKDTSNIAPVDIEALNLALYRVAVQDRALRAPPKPKPTTAPPSAPTPGPGESRVNGERGAQAAGRRGIGSSSPASRRGAEGRGFVNGLHALFCCGRRDSASDESTGSYAVAGRKKRQREQR